MQRLLLLVFMLSVLSGCGARLVSHDAKQVVVTNVTKHTEGDAQRIADKACAEHRKQAFQVSSDSGTTTYRCID